MSHNYPLALFPQHADMLKESGITPEHAAARGYRSVDTKKRLADLGITQAGRNIPGLLVPQLRADGSTWGYQYRPDQPRTNGHGKPVKYETPVRQPNGIDVPPGIGPNLDDPTMPLFITEGVKKADAGVLNGLCIVAIPGVWSWLGTNPKRGKTALPEWRDIALNGRRVILAFDGDVSRKQSVRRALDALASYLASKGAKVAYLHLPDHDNKVGLDDYLTEHTVQDLWRLVHPEPPPVTQRPDEEPHQQTSAAAPPNDTRSGPVTPVTLDQCRATFTHWLGDDYDLDALHATLAAAAVERLNGDPLWLLIISGSGNAKTETVQALTGAHAIVTSSISSPGALLSGTSRHERAKDSTGGLLRKIGAAGVLVVKDVTSILSMNRDTRSEVLAAMREVYDGHWSRNLGTDGGKTLDWRGRLGIVGAVTTAWDRAHDVIASMGDRFVLLRMDSTEGRQTAGRKAIANTGHEEAMRQQLAATVGGVIAGMNTTGIEVTDQERDTLLAAADLVTLARTGVEYDYRGDVIDAHAPEMPTRFAKQLSQVVRGGVAIGMHRTDALRLAIRCARDSMPPLRLAILDDLAEHPDSTTAEVRKRLNKPRNTIDRQLQALHMLGALACFEEDTEWAGKPATRWHYRIADGIDPHALNYQEISSRFVSTTPQTPKEEARTEAATPRPPTDKSGTDRATASRTSTCGNCGADLTAADHQARTGLCGYCEQGITPSERQRRTTP